MPEVNPHSTPVTIVISRRVKKGKEAEYEKISTALTTTAARFKGYLGTNMFKPASPDDPEYRVIFKFDNQKNYQTWAQSEERSHCLENLEPLLEAPSSTEVMEGLVTWFSIPGSNPVKPPPKYKMAVVSWLAIFPTVTLIFGLFGEPLSRLPLIPRTIIVTLVVILLMTFVLMPRFTRWFSFWLFPKKNRNIR